jgi:hypothetical protein
MYYTVHRYQEPHTTSRGSLPAKASARWSTTALAVWSITSKLAAPTWGLDWENQHTAVRKGPFAKISSRHVVDGITHVETTLGWLISLENLSSVGGSSLHASRPAPVIIPSSNASARASSSITPPLAVLMTTADFFIRRS